MTMIDTPEGIEAFRLLAIRGRLQLELKGLKFRGGSTFAYVKREFNLKGNRESVFAQYEDMLYDRGILKRERLCKECDGPIHGTSFDIHESCKRGPA